MLQKTCSYIAKAIKNPIKIWYFLRVLTGRPFEYIYAFFDSKAVKALAEPVLFIDCGSNIGQGYQWFSRFYNQGNIDFHLFEPNPNCYPYLKKITTTGKNQVTLFKVGAGTSVGKVKFYGLADYEGGKLSQGGSINKAHNSGWYEASEQDAIEVEIIDFPAYLIEQSKKYAKIVVKMDIEGAEVELLEKLIGEGQIDLINVLYVEFHAQYQTPAEAKITRAREKAITHALRKHPTLKFRIWH